MWDERYSEPGFAFSDQPNDFLVQMVDKLPRGRVLCLAEGEGRNAVYLAQQGFQVTAVDQSEVGLAKARALASSRGVSIATVAADLADFVIEPNSWDVIVSIWAHLPLTLRLKVHGQIVAGLRPGGALVLEAYTPEQLQYNTGGPPVAEMMMRLVELQEEFAGLRFLVAQEIVRTVREGKYHDGPSAVVQMLGFVT